jgi:hypothetical protein
MSGTLPVVPAARDAHELHDAHDVHALAEMQPGVVPEAGEAFHSKKFLAVRDWLSQLNGYDLRLWSYTHDCSRLSLRATDCIAKRPSALLVFHDVSYIELPLRTGKIRAREANEKEIERVQIAMGRNFQASNVVAFAATNRRVFLLEYGFVQWLKQQV